MRPRSLVVGLLLLSAIGCVSSRQSGDPGGSAPTGSQVLTHTFSNPAGEFVRVFLASGVTYEAELDGGSIRLQVRPTAPGVQNPRVEERMAGSSAGGSSVFTIQPRADGEYEFRAVGGDPGRPLTLRVKMLPKRGGQ